MRLIMTVGVYGIFNVETNKCLYVGMSSVSIEKRFKQHLKRLKSKIHPRSDFVEWYHNNGADTKIISFKVLEECENNNDILNKLEMKWFNELEPKYYGKKPSLNEKWEHSEEAKEKIRKARYSLLGKNYKDRFCEFCNQPINKTERYCDRKYCSKECSYEGKKNSNKICVICSKSFSYNRERKTCSDECSEKLRKSSNGKVKIDISKDTLYEMYCNQSMTVIQIAESLNCSRRAIYDYLKKFDINRGL